MSKPFNVRVYGWLEHEGKVLIIQEPFAGEIIFKFPGGGLEYGEGLKDCLVREFQEELNLEIEVQEHLYTQDYFLASRFDLNEQIIMIYYRVKALNIDNLKVIDTDIEQLIWLDIHTIQPSHLTLPTDKLVVEMMRSK